MRRTATAILNIQSTDFYDEALEQPVTAIYSMLFLHALVAKASIFLGPTGPLIDGSSSASTTASPTVST